jgi:hypothetical protein
MVADIMDAPACVTDEDFDAALEAAGAAAEVYKQAILALVAIQFEDDAIPEMIERLYELAGQLAYEAAHAELIERGYTAGSLRHVNVTVLAI